MTDLEQLKTMLERAHCTFYEGDDKEGKFVEVENMLFCFHRDGSLHYVCDEATGRVL